jgi:kynureninase
VTERVTRLVAQEWGEAAVRGWNRHGWLRLPLEVGRRIAGWIGAEPETVIVTDSTSVNLLRALHLALRVDPERREIVVERENFPADGYVAGGLAAACPGVTVRPVDREHLATAPGRGTAVVLASHVSWRDGAMLDAPAITAAAQHAGATMLWDLCHSAGAVPVDVAAWGADFAVGCGYKYLCGGPGAPSFLYVAPRHQHLTGILTTWLGHADPFAFELEWRPAPGIRRHLGGTPAILSLAALDAALDVVFAAPMPVIRRRSLALGDAFMAGLAGSPFEVLTPTDEVRRGSMVCLRHPHANALSRCLGERGVVADFRAPDVLRFGIAGHYVSARDVHHTVEVLRALVVEQPWLHPESVPPVAGVVT